MAYIKIEDCNLNYEVNNVGFNSIKKVMINSLRIKSKKNKIIVNSLKNINLKIYDSEKVGFVGSNGSGKTSLLKIIAGIYEPSVGKIETEGKISAYISNSSLLNPELDAIQNIKSYCLFHKVKKEELDNVISYVTDFSELGNFMFMPINTYSAGMQARLNFSLATSFVNDIILIDEGLGTGDKDFQIKAKKKISDLIDNSKIFVFANHNVKQVREFGCNRIITLEKGVIISDQRFA